MSVNLTVLFALKRSSPYIECENTLLYACTTMIMKQGGSKKTHTKYADPMGLRVGLVIALRPQTPKHITIGCMVTLY
jgi:hypothetical protein